MLDKSKFVKKVLVSLVITASVVLSANAQDNHNKHEYKSSKHKSVNNNKKFYSSSNHMTNRLFYSIKRTGIAKDGYISIRDVKKLNYYMIKNYGKKARLLHRYSSSHRDLRRISSNLNKALIKRVMNRRHA